MAFLIAGLIVVFLLCAVDLVLTVGVIRRLREHTEMLSRFSSREGAPEILPVGATVAPFTALTIEGQPVSREMLETPALVGLLSATCESCHEQLPRFLERAAGMPGREHVLAVVVGMGDDADALVPKLSNVARVVMEEPGGRVAAAFGANMFPVAYLIEDGYAVVAGATRLDGLPPLPEVVRATADR